MSEIITVYYLEIEETDTRLVFNNLVDLQYCLDNELTLSLNCLGDSLTIHVQQSEMQRHEYNALEDEPEDELD